MFLHVLKASASNGSKNKKWYFFGRKLWSGLQWNLIISEWKHNDTKIVLSCCFVIALLVRGGVKKKNLYFWVVGTIGGGGIRGPTTTFGQKSTSFFFCFHSIQNTSKRVNTQKKIIWLYHPIPPVNRGCQPVRGSYHVYKLFMFFENQKCQKNVKLKKNKQRKVHVQYSYSFKNI